MLIKEVILETNKKPLSHQDQQVKNLEDQSKRLRQQAKVIRARDRFQSAQAHLTKVKQSLSK
jgi:hypothetical protein